MTKYKDGGRYLAKYNGVQQAFTYQERKGDYPPRFEFISDIDGKSIDEDSFYLTEITELTGIRAAKVGDIVFDEYGDERKILAIDNQHNMIWYSRPNDFDSHCGSITFSDAKKDGWKLKIDKPKTTLTKSEIAKKFKVDVGDLEIKDE